MSHTRTDLGERLTRRGFVRALGATTFGVALLGAACGTDGGSGADVDASPAASASPTTGRNSPDGLEYRRVTRQGVAAYLLVRSGEVALVDTGGRGTDAQVADALEQLGLGWDDVAHVILTHDHGDHIGGLPATVAAAPDATLYAGAEDIPGVASALTSERAITAVTDGDVVFGLDVIATPGHTPGHICVLDRAAGLLLVGDALNGGGDGTVDGPNERYTSDMDAAMASVAKLGGYEFETALFGHGPPVEERAAELVRALAQG